MLRLPASILKSYRNVLNNIADARFDDIRRLWQGFNEERRTGRYLDAPGREANAYLRAFHLPNVARTLSVLARCKLPTFDRIVDLGCGTGAMSHALSISFKGEVELVDRRKAFLEIAQTWHENPTVRLQDVRTWVQKHRVSSSELWVVGYLLNELPEPIIQKLCKLFLSADHPVTLLMVDSAHAHWATKMMATRDFLVSAKARVLYPCPLSTERCPMVGTRDRCFSEFSWQPPPEQLKWDRLLEIRHERMAASAYVVTNDQKMNSRSVPIVVGRPLTERGPMSLICDGRKIRKIKLKEDVLRGEPSGD